LAHLFAIQCGQQRISKRAQAGDYVGAKMVSAK
jgi:hypothetical protein